MRYFPNLSSNYFARPHLCKKEIFAHVSVFCIFIIHVFLMTSYYYTLDIRDHSQGAELIDFLIIILISILLRNLGMKT